MAYFAQITKKFGSRSDDAGRRPNASQLPHLDIPGVEILFMVYFGPSPKNLWPYGPAPGKSEIECSGLEKTMSHPTPD